MLSGALMLGVKESLIIWVKVFLFQIAGKEALVDGLLATRR
jgi:hypothetical protein